jgi:integrase/recombinase XerD
MKTSVKILFWLGLSSQNAKGQAPINCRVTVAGKRTELRTGIWVEPKEWSDARKKVLGSGPAARTANAALTKMQDQLNDLHADLERQDKPVTAQALARGYKADGAVLNMLELFEAFSVERQQLVGVEVSKASVSVDKARYALLTAFLEAKQLTHLRPEEFTCNLADKLLYWLLAERKLGRGYANKVLQTVNQVLRWGVRREYLSSNPMQFYKLKRAETNEIKFLGVGELAQLSAATLAVPCLERVRDYFVFQCWTGLAYADLAALNVAASAEYYKDKSGNLHRRLRVRRAKSTIGHGYECIIPLLPEAERILALHGDKLPVPTNQVYNRYLKQVAELCGLEADKITSHVGRKTAGTLLLNMGVPLPVVSKILGHANTLITQRVYAKLLDTTVADALSGFMGGGLQLGSVDPLQIQEGGLAL